MINDDKLLQPPTVSITTIASHATLPTTNANYILSARHSSHIHISCCPFSAHSTFEMPLFPISHSVVKSVPVQAKFCTV